MKTLRIIRIVEGTSVDGPGLRTSVYLAGCPHHCSGCHNPQTWNPEQGEIIGVDELCDRLLKLGMNVTFSGGDPLMQAIPLAEACRIIKEKNGQNIWCYTGFCFEEILRKPELRNLLRWIDVLVDGPFNKELCDTSLLFRGSSNQRLIDINHWRSTAEILEWHSDF